MRFGLLGPFVVEAGDGPLGIGKGNERALLALLALHANEPLSTDRIVDALWGEQPPSTARDMVRLYVSRARRAIGDHLLTEAAGYVLRAAANEVDLTEFNELRRVGSAALAAGNVKAAAAALRDALDCWRGDALAEFADLPFAREAIPRLQELRLAASEDYQDARLSIGEASELVPELERLVEENPYRERLRGQLMLALYRGGRQTDALTRYRDGRRLMVDEVGIEPGPQLRELERAILAQDPALASPPRRQQAAPPPMRQRSAKKPRVAVLGVVVAAAAAVATLAILSASGSPAPLRRLPPNSLGLIDTRSTKLSAAIALPGVPIDVAASAGRLWVALGEPHEIVEIDPAGKTIMRTVQTRAVPRRIAPMTNGIVIDNSYDGTVSRLGTDSKTISAPRRLFRATRISFATEPGLLWAASSPGGQAAELDSRDATVLRRVRGLNDPIAISTGFGALWLASSTRAEVQRLSGSHLTSIPIGALPGAIAVGSGAVWAVTPVDGKLWRINPRDHDVVDIIPVAPDPEYVVATNGSIWVGSHRNGSLTRVNPRTNQVISTVRVGRPINGLSVYRGELWVAVA